MSAWAGDVSCPTARRRGQLSESQERGIRRMWLEDFPATQIALAQSCSSTGVKSFASRDPECQAHRRAGITPDSLSNIAAARARAFKRQQLAMTAPEIEEER